MQGKGIEGGRLLQHIQFLHLTVYAWVQQNCCTFCFPICPCVGMCVQYTEDQCKHISYCTFTTPRALSATPNAGEREACSPFCNVP